jgi:hypothetical protein
LPLLLLAQMLALAQDNLDQVVHTVEMVMTRSWQLLKEQLVVMQLCFQVTAMVEPLEASVDHQVALEFNKDKHKSLTSHQVAVDQAELSTSQSSE